MRSSASESSPRLPRTPFLDKSPQAVSMDKPCRKEWQRPSAALGTHTKRMLQVSTVSSLYSTGARGTPAGRKNRPLSVLLSLLKSLLMKVDYLRSQNLSMGCPRPPGPALSDSTETIVYLKSPVGFCWRGSVFLCVRLLRLFFLGEGQIPHGPHCCSKVLAQECL